MTNNNYNPPSRSAKDIGHVIVKAAIASIPIAGGAAAEFFAALVVPPIEKRRDEWMQSIGEALTTLEQKGFIKLDDLVNNDIFIDTLLRVSQSALKTSQQEKLLLLRNVILNRALNISPDANTEHVLMELIDSLTPLHLQTLYHFRREIGKNVIGDKDATFIKHFVELREHPIIGEQIWRDLISKGLIIEWKGINEVGANATDLGFLLLDLVLDPIISG